MFPRRSDPPFAIATQHLRLGAHAARKLLGNRISLSAVKHWRAGRRKPPEWVFEILDKELAAIESAAAAARKAIVGAASPGQGYWDKTGASLSAWRAHRAAQKEKAGS